MRHIDRVQRLFERLGVVPTYVVDYPVATQPEGYETLRAWARERPVRDRRAPASVGHAAVRRGGHRRQQLRGQPAARRSRAAKLRVLCGAIDEHLGVTPRTFKAGRYGIGPPTPRRLRAAGPASRRQRQSRTWTSTGDDGPDFTGVRRAALLVRHRRRSCSKCRARTATSAGPRVRARRSAALAAQPSSRRCGCPAFSRRPAIVNQVMLSPEGNTLDEMMAPDARAARARRARCSRSRSTARRSCRAIRPTCAAQADLDGFLDVHRALLRVLLRRARRRAIDARRLPPRLARRALRTRMKSSRHLPARQGRDGHARRGRPHPLRRRRGALHAASSSRTASRGRRCRAASKRTGTEPGDIDVRRLSVPAVGRGDAALHRRASSTSATFLVEQESVRRRIAAAAGAAARVPEPRPRPIPGLQPSQRADGEGRSPGDAAYRVLAGETRGVAQRRAGAAPISGAAQAQRRSTSTGTRSSRRASASSACSAS